LTCSSRSFERSAKRIVISQRLQIRIVPRERAIFGVQRDRSFEMRDRLRVLVALSVGDGKHVDGVVVIGIFVANEAEMCDRLIVLAAVD
jgi:hypothetical protein